MILPDRRRHRGPHPEDTVLFANPDHLQKLALAGGLLLRGHDRVWRNLVSVHGTYRQVQETHAALEAIGSYLTLLGPSEVVFLIDAPVSNSARLASCIRTLAQKRGWPWHATLDSNVDSTLQRTPDVVATSDSVILDCAPRWFDLTGAVVQQMTSAAWCVDLNMPPPHVD